jgi:hypothetical protein
VNDMGNIGANDFDGSNSSIIEVNAIDEGWIDTEDDIYIFFFVCPLASENL